MASLDILDVERIIRRAGAERVSEGAGQKLAEVLEEKAQEIAERAVRLSKYANKRTLTRADIEIALMYELGEMGKASPHAEFEKKAAGKRRPVPLAI